MFYRCDRSAQPQNAAISPIDQNENLIEQTAKNIITFHPENLAVHPEFCIFESVFQPQNR